MRNRTTMWFALFGALSACASPAPFPPLPIPVTPPSLLPGPVEAPTATPVVRAPAPANPAAPRLASERALQMEDAVLTHLSRLQRLHDLSLPLLRHGVDICGDHGKEFGFRYGTLDQYPDPAERQVYETIVGLRSRPTVSMVIDGSAADRAGLVRGDVITAVATVEIAEGQAGRDAIARMLERWPADTPIPVDILRDGAAVRLGFPPEPICDYAVSLSDNPEINAWATGDEVLIGMGLMRFSLSDNELQAAIAHEIAHNSERHQQAKADNLVLAGLRGAVRDVAAAATGVEPQGTFSRTHEREADYVGMYYLARAGVVAGDVGLLWRRLAAENLEGVKGGEASTHPSSPERLLLLEAVHQEIVRKLESGRPLLPSRAADGTLIIPEPGGES